MERPQTIITLARGYPPSGHHIVVSTDSRGNSGPLNELVRRTVGFNPGFDPDILSSQGYHIRRSPTGETISGVVTVNAEGDGNPGETELLLAQNLERLLIDLINEPVGELDREPSLWMPVMGTGSGGLSLELAMDLTLQVLARQADGLPFMPIIISLPSNVSDDVVADAFRTVEDLHPQLALVVDHPPNIPGAESLANDEIAYVQSILRKNGAEDLIPDGFLGPATFGAIANLGLSDDERYGKFSDLFPDLSETALDGLYIAIYRARMAFPPAGKSDETPRSDVAETAPYYPDDPAQIDQLNRKSVAATLTTIIKGVWTGAERDAGDQSFIVHLHGPWGSGKTSILNFMEDLLGKMKLPVKEASDKYPRGQKHPWLVVQFNAWRMQGHGPPWWTLIDAVYRKAISDPHTEDKWHVRLQHFGWRFQHGWLLSAAQIAVMAMAILIVALGPDEGGFADLLKGSAGVAGVISALFFLKGDGGLLNSKASQRFRELSEDPIGPLTRRFDGLIADTGRPVAIFIDDLDRCNADYVVDLLTQIQTLFRKANVLYVVAGDRSWICSSYEQTYEDFSGKIAAPGHSLGHMFLEKIFQISVEVPEITEDQRKAFLGHLLQADEGSESEDLAAVEKAAEKDMANVKTEAEVIAKNDAFEGTAAAKAVYSAKALEVLHRPKLARERQKHILLNYADHLEPNPRAMKRLLNAYGFRRGFDIQAAERSDQDALIRWTIIENRWPVMATYLSGKPVTDDERKALVSLKDDPRLKAIFDDVDWTKLAILKDVQTRFDKLAPS